MKILRGYVLAYGLSGHIIASSILLSITAISMLGIKYIKLLEK